MSGKVGVVVGRNGGNGCSLRSGGGVGMSRDMGRDRGGGGCGRSVNTGRHGRGRRVMETQENRGGRCGTQVETGSRDGVNMWWPGMGGWYGWRCGCLAGLVPCVE